MDTVQARPDQLVRVLKLITPADHAALINAPTNEFPNQQAVDRLYADRIGRDLKNVTLNIITLEELFAYRCPICHYPAYIASKNEQPVYAEPATV